MRKSKNRYFNHIFISPGDAPEAITLNVVSIEREFDAYKLSRSMYPSIFNSFPVIRTATAKNRHFHVPQPTFFVSPGDAPATITKYIAWMERQFNACQTTRSMYLSIFNSFRVIRWLSPKIAIFTYRSRHFCFPWRRFCDYHAMCCMDGKSILCLPNSSQHISIYLEYFPSYTMLKSMRKFKNRYFLPRFGFPLGRPWCNHAKCCMDGKRIRCLQIVSLHVPI